MLMYKKPIINIAFDFNLEKICRSLNTSKGCTILVEKDSRPS